MYRNQKSFAKLLGSKILDIKHFLDQNSFMVIRLSMQNNQES